MTFVVPRGMRGTVAEMLRALRRPDLALWGAYIVLFPLYILPSGLPQPGDLLIIPLALVVLAGGPLRLPRAGIRPTRALLAFTLYVLASSLFWTLVTGKITFNAKEGFLATPVFYVYNAAFFVITLVLYQRHRQRFVWITLQALLATVVLECLLSLGHVGPGRSIGTFNNPNQLGYFAVAAASILSLGRRRVGLDRSAAVLGLVACAYLAVLSSSKAAIGAVVILAAVAMIRDPRRLLMVGLAFGALTLFPNPLTRALDRAEHRIRNDESATFILERGYDRILDNPRYWVMGAGEGGTRRFLTQHFGAHEIHSSLGTVFFSYGVVGLLIFLTIAFSIARGTAISEWAMLLPVAAYGMTHQGLRSTLLWVLLAFYVCLKDGGMLQTSRRPAGRAPRPVGATATTATI